MKCVFIQLCNNHRLLCEPTLKLGVKPERTTCHCDKKEHYSFTNSTVCALYYFGEDGLFSLSANSHHKMVLSCCWSLESSSLADGKYFHLLISDKTDNNKLKTEMGVKHILESKKKKKITKL